jgi:hypothetical protein
LFSSAAWLPLSLSFDGTTDTIYIPDSLQQTHNNR